MSSSIQDLITENETAAVESEAMGTESLQRGEAIVEAARAVTSEARRRVMAVSATDGGLLAQFQAYGGDEKALQRLLAESIGGIDAHLDKLARNAREFSVAAATRAMTLREQAEKLRGMIEVRAGNDGSTEAQRIAEFPYAHPGDS